MGWPTRLTNGLAGQELHHLFGVAHVAFHAQRQGLNALQDQPGAVRAQAGAKVAQALAARAQQEGAPVAFFGEHHVVKAVVGLGSAREICPHLSQSKLPPSTTMPPITVPWPDRNLVAEW